MKGAEGSSEMGQVIARGVRPTANGTATALRLLEEYPAGRRFCQASNSALERTAGSHSLAAAAHRDRSA